MMPQPSHLSLPFPSLLYTGTWNPSSYSSGCSRDYTTRWPEVGLVIEIENEIVAKTKSKRMKEEEEEEGAGKYASTVPLQLSEYYQGRGLIWGTTPSWPLSVPSSSQHTRRVFHYGPRTQVPHLTRLHGASERGRERGRETLWSVMQLASVLWSRLIKDEYKIKLKIDKEFKNRN